MGNTEIKRVGDPFVIKESDIEIAIKVDNSEWNKSGVKVDLYQNGVSKATTTASNGNLASFIDVENGTYLFEDKVRIERFTNSKKGFVIIGEGIMRQDEKGILITPGCSNPSDVEIALENGLEVVKFFPAEPAGGLKMIKALAAPYVSLKFMPTGGITPSNVRDYLAYDRIIACGGSWMVKNELVKAGDFAAITEMAKECVQIVKESRGE